MIETGCCCSRAVLASRFKYISGMRNSITTSTVSDSVLPRIAEGYSTLKSGRPRGTCGGVVTCDVADQVKVPWIWQLQQRWTEIVLSPSIRSRPSPTLQQAAHPDVRPSSGGAAELPTTPRARYARFELQHVQTLKPASIEDNNTGEKSLLLVSKYPRYVTRILLRHVLAAFFPYILYVLL